MKNVRTLVIAGTIAGVGLASIAGSGIAVAMTTAGESSIVSRLAEKFNVKESDVQAVFEENRAAKRAEKQQKATSYLQSLVDTGKITAEQKTLIETKRAELDKQRETERANLEKWATDNNIDITYVMGGKHTGGHGHRGDHSPQL